MKSLSDQLSFIRAAKRRRERDPGWTRKYTPEQAAHETECLDAVERTLEKLVLLEQVSEEILTERN